MVAGFNFNELCCDANAASAFAYAAFQHIAHIELCTNVLDLDGLTFVDKRRITCNDIQFLKASQLGNDVFANPVGEVRFVRVLAHVRERQHRYRGFGSLRRLCSVIGCGAWRCAA